MHRQADEEVATVFVSLKLGRWRPVGRHHLEDPGDPRGTALREVQLFQERANTAVAIAAAHGTPGAQVVHPDGVIRPRKTQDHQIFAGEAHFDRLTDLVGSMINRVDHGLFDGRQRDVPQSLRFWTVRVLMTVSFR